MLVVAREELDNYINKSLDPSDWFKIDQERINHFANATLDHQFIHVDVDQAAQTPFGSTIAHGFLTLSLLPYFTAQSGIAPENIMMAINYGSDKIRFLQPVTVNSEVRAHVKLLEVTEKNPGQLLFKTEVTVEIKGKEKPALVAQTLSLFFVS